MTLPRVRVPALSFAAAFAAVVAARAQATLYFDVNGQSAQSGLTSGLTSAWAGTNWTDQQHGSNNGHPVGAWVAGSNAVFSAGADGTCVYTVTIATSTLVGTVEIQEGAPIFEVASGALWTFSTASSFTLASAITGAGGIAKLGAGALTLSGANTFTGSVTLGGGALIVAAPAAMPAVSAITLGGGTLQAGVAGTFATSGPLAVTASSTINFGVGMGPTIFSFGASAGATWQPGATLTVLNYDAASGDRLRVGHTAGGLTLQQLSQITFSGFAPGATIDAAGYLAPVPEPALNAALLGAAGLAFAAWRRRRATA